MALSTGRMMRFAAIGFEFAWPMIAGAILGHYLDLYFRTEPWLTLAMFLSTAHTNADIDRTIAAANESLREVARGKA